MELYINNCLKAAAVAAAKVIASNMRKEEDTHGAGNPKLPIPGTGAVNLSEKPLGTKLPAIPGSSNVRNTTDLHEKHYSPYRFNLNKPRCQHLDTSYKSLNDPHFKKHYGQKDIKRTVKKGGYSTGKNKEHVEKRINRTHEHRYREDIDTQFQQQLLMQGAKRSPEQDQFLRHRYLEMIEKELEKMESCAGRRNRIPMKGRHRSHIRRQLDLRTPIDKDWKSRELALLMKIMENVGREARVKEHHRHIREEMDRKQQDMLHKRIVYHLQKMQIIPSEEKTPEKGTDHGSKKKASLMSQTKEPPEQKRLSSTKPRVSLKEDQSTEEHQEGKRASSTTPRTSLTEDQSTEEHQERKGSSSVAKKTSLGEDQLYEDIYPKYTPQVVKKKSVADDQQYEEVDTKYFQPTIKKTSFMDEIPWPKRLDQKRNSSSAKKKSLAEDELYEEVNPKSFYQSMKKTSGVDEVLLPDSLQQKRTSSISKKKSLAEYRLYEDLDPQSLQSRKIVNFVAAPFPKQLQHKCASSTTPRTSLTEDQSAEEHQEPKHYSPSTKRTSFPGDKLTQEHLEQKQSIQYFHGDKISANISTTLPPQLRNVQTMTEQQEDKEIAGTSNLSYNSRIRSIPFNVLPTSARRTEVPRHSLLDITKPEITHGSFNGKKTKKSSLKRESVQGICCSWDSPNKQRIYYEDCPQKIHPLQQKKENQFTLYMNEQLNINPLQTSSNCPSLELDTAEEEYLMDARSKTF
uniref:fibrous sheath-interacting protein 2-like isoform X2 n=1 Tax=Jaculus jaculus TaxID=51337 RepID=UPI001E1B06B8|nr:fibrous sheath-interacting protein 2-like isoform X2 [Jaculus jaculus]